MKSWHPCKCYVICCICTLSECYPRHAPKERSQGVNLKSHSTSKISAILKCIPKMSTMAWTTQNCEEIVLEFSSCALAFILFFLPWQMTMIDVCSLGTNSISNQSDKNIIDIQSWCVFIANFDETECDKITRKMNFRFIVEKCE